MAALQLCPDDFSAFGHLSESPTMRASPKTKPKPEHSVENCYRISASQVEEEVLNDVGLFCACAEGENSGRKSFTSRASGRGREKGVAANDFSRGFAPVSVGSDTLLFPSNGRR